MPLKPAAAHTNRHIITSLPPRRRLPVTLLPVPLPLLPAAHTLNLRWLGLGSRHTTGLDSSVQFVPEEDAIGHVIGPEAVDIDSFPNFDTARSTAFSMLHDALEVHLYAPFAEGAAVHAISPGFTPEPVEPPRFKLFESGPGLPLTRVDIAVNIISSQLKYTKYTCEANM
jgi:hypothetical protein